MGAASEGGYLGADSASFFSAVLSGAAGSYIVTLTADAGISTDLVIEPGQDVRISGDLALGAAPSWGSGGFTVQQDGLLSLTGLALAGSLAALSEGTLHLNQVAFVGRAYDLLLMEGAIFTRQGGADPFDSQCNQPYTTLTDNWRATTSGTGYHFDSAAAAEGTGVGGGHWYRFTGPGDALPLSSPGVENCGTINPGWLTGWTGPITGNQYGTPGGEPGLHLVFRID